MKKSFFIPLVCCAALSFSAYSQEKKSLKTMAENVLTVKEFEKNYSELTTIEKNNTSVLAVSGTKSTPDIALVIYALNRYVSTSASRTISEKIAGRKQIFTESLSKKISQLEFLSNSTLRTSLENFTQDISLDVSISASGKKICVLNRKNDSCTVKTDLTAAQLMALLEKNGILCSVDAYAEDGNEKKAFFVFSPVKK